MAVKRIRLDFRKAYRKVAKLEIAAMASDVGRSFAGAVRKLRARIRVWGYVVPYASLGQKFWWFLNGAVRPGSKQPARPVPNRSAEFAKALLDEVGLSAAEQLQAADRSVAA